VREKLAWRWIGAHAAALGLSSALIGPLEAGWKVHFGDSGLGFLAVFLVLGCGSVAFVQTRVPRTRRFPVSFPLWGLASCLSAVLATAAALSSVGGWSDLSKDWFSDSIGLSLAGYLIMPMLSYALVNSLAQGLVLYWKTRSGTSWLWTAGLALAELFGVLLSLLRAWLLGGWVDAPGARTWQMLVVGAVHGSILGIATLIPVRRVLERPEQNDPLDAAR
jgi:hypothetical protein